MKRWWPWRKTKPLLTLFSGRVPRDEPSVAGLVRRSPLNPQPIGAHPKNAPGGFFVENEECMSCGVPHHCAPELMAWDNDSEGRPNHCYFRKQPETALELIHAVKAIEGSCCGAVRYGGSDPEIISRLKDAGCADAIDHRCS